MNCKKMKMLSVGTLTDQKLTLVYCIILKISPNTCKSQLDEVEGMSDERGDDPTCQPSNQMFISETREK